MAEPSMTVFISPFCR